MNHFKEQQRAPNRWNPAEWNIPRRFVLAFVCSIFSPAVFAIPSPDLVINLSASVAQLLGLLSVLFGGFLFNNKRAPGKRGSKRIGRTGRNIFIFLLGGLILSLTINLLQYTRSIDQKNSRLHTNLVRKSVENGKAVGDTNLKTLSFSDQNNHPNGISTETLSQWLSQGKDLNIYDVREDAEIEGGYIDGAQHIRYPDLLANPDIIPKTGNNLLLCYSGNRSSELCNLLDSSGNSCNFLVGGYEKWLTESRPLNSASGNNNELRSLPDFKNKETLLDTNEVHELVNKEKAQFIDVRYPGDYSLSHLPNSHNITMRALSSVDLENRVKQLPDVPLIAACYDKRSCFYSQLMGLNLVRKGMDYRGRYTVPHEFYQTNGDREHVQLWRTANEKVTLVTAVISPLTQFLQWLATRTGHYVAGIVLLVLMVRLFLLPLTLKSERDHAVQKSLQPILKKYQSDYNDHPRALTKATLELFRKNRIKPVFNIVSSLAQLSLLLLFYSVVNKAAQGWTQHFAWLNLPSQADPLLILPLLVTGLLVVVLSMQLNIETKKAKTILIAGAMVLFALVHKIGAAVNIYLVCSMLVLIAQNFLVRYLNKRLNWDGQHPRSASAPPEDDGIIPLSQSHLLPSTGKKAARLGELIAAGYNVPDGFVITDHINANFGSDQNEQAASSFNLSQPQLRKLHQLWNNLDARKVAVRSSGVSEDGSDTSFAGVYDSLLNVRKKELLSAVRKVHQSLSSERASSYNNGVNSQTSKSADLEEYGGVIVQKMIDAEYAGVMFTEHPMNTGTMLIEMVAGLGEDLVSGAVTPVTLTFGKYTGQLISPSHCEIDLSSLLALGRELEQLFDHPQDIEWAYRDGEFFLLQTRDITRSVCDKQTSVGAAESERRRLIGLVKHAGKDEPCLLQNELSELLPNPTAASLSFMQMLWSAGGSTDIACQQLGIPYDVSFKSNDFVTTVYGKTFINKIEERYRLKKGPGAMAAFQLARNSDAIERHFRDEVLPEIIESSAINKAIDYSRLSLSDMTATLKNKLEHFVKETYVEAEVINIAADYYWKTATAKLKADGIDPAKYLNHVPATETSKALSLLSEPIAEQQNIAQFLAISGHRAPFDYELSMPRYEEDPAYVVNLLKSQTSHPVGNQSIPILPKKKLHRISVDRVHRFQALKEDAKHFSLIPLYQIRRLLLAIDSHCQFQGQIFHLRLEEILQLSDTLDAGQARTIIDRRKQQQVWWKSIHPPTQLSLSDLELMDVSSGQVQRDTGDDTLRGKHVAGEGSITGVARVIFSVDDIDQFEKGEILVARMTDPRWYPLFPLANGIVTEIGGWLSHAAIVAREYSLPAIVGAKDACNLINTGDVIELRPDGSIALVRERRHPDSAMRTTKHHIQETSATDAVQDTTETNVIKLYSRTRPGINGKRSIYNKRDREAKQLLRNYVRRLNTESMPLRKAQ